MLRTSRTARLALTALSLTAIACGAPPPVSTPPLTTASPSPSVAAVKSATGDPTPTTPTPVAPPYGTDADLGAWTDAYVSSFGKSWGEAYAFSGYIAVTRDGKPIYARAYGKANRESGAVADADTRFRIGSITKQFTATCVMQLAEKGKLEVDDPLRKYLPDYPKSGDKVTLHHLLTHTSGIPSFTDDEALMKVRGTRHTQAEVLATFKDKPLEFEPGERFAYSNSGYFLLGLVIEKVSGQSYEAYLQEHVLGPAGMKRSSTIDAEDAPNTAVGYDNDDDDKIERAHGVDMSLPFSAGALRSTASDLFAWDRALAGNLLLTDAAKQRMYSPEKDNYAYGWVVWTEDGRKIAGHDGGIDGFASSYRRIPEERLVLVALANHGFELGKIMKPLTTMLLTGKKAEPPAERAEVPMDGRVVARAAGEYALSVASKKMIEGKVPATTLDSIKTIAIKADKGKLFLKPAKQERVRLYLGEAALLFAKKAGVEITLDGDQKGMATGFALKQGGLALSYERVKPFIKTR